MWENVVGEKLSADIFSYCFVFMFCSYAIPFLQPFGANSLVLGGLGLLVAVFQHHLIRVNGFLMIYLGRQRDIKGNILNIGIRWSFRMIHLVKVGNYLVKIPKILHTPWITHHVSFTYSQRKWKTLIWIFPPVNIIYNSRILYSRERYGFKITLSRVPREKNIQMALKKSSSVAC